jgi:hypothetical protein
LTSSLSDSETLAWKPKETSSSAIFRLAKPKVLLENPFPYDAFSYHTLKCFIEYHKARLIKLLPEYSNASNG